MLECLFKYGKYVILLINGFLHVLCFSRSPIPEIAIGLCTGASAHRCGVSRTYAQPVDVGIAAGDQ